MNGFGHGPTVGETAEMPHGGGKSSGAFVSHCLAVDFGASSVRLIDVGLTQGRLSLAELARRPNVPLYDGGVLSWDYDALFSWLADALVAAARSGVAYDSIGADSWGVDYVLLDGQGRRIGPAVAYRDRRTAGMVERFTAHVLSEDALYAATGIPSLSINTLFQAYAQGLADGGVFVRAQRVLFTADYVQYWLSGVMANERTLASTSQMLGLDGQWWADALAAVGLPTHALSAPVAAGTILGPQNRVPGLAIPVIAPCAHDTQSAILAVPAMGQDWAYLSSGTWSILGVESPHPVTGRPFLAGQPFPTDQQARVAGIGNEAGFGGTFCIQSTVTGLWLVQEIRRILGGNLSDGELAHLAGPVAPFRTLIDPEHPRFVAPADMVAEIRAAADEAGEPVPQTPGELARCVFDSLALLYRSKIERLSALTGRKIARLHVVGGGAQADVLNRLCASVTGLPVFAGPVEATAIGNGLAQMIALGHVADVAAARALVAASFAPVCFAPEPVAGLLSAVARFADIAKP